MSNKKLPENFVIAQDLIFRSLGMSCDDIQVEAEGKEYEALSCKWGDKFIKFRSAKTTPTKLGQFVTFWKRIGSGPTMAYDTSDKLDYCIVVAHMDKNFGLFIFPKLLLRVKGILSIDGKGGKRAFRVYPSWVVTENKQAYTSQQWQQQYFIQTKKDGSVDELLLKKLLPLHS